VPCPPSQSLEPVAEYPLLKLSLNFLLSQFKSRLQVCPEYSFGLLRDLFTSISNTGWFCQHSREFLPGFFNGCSTKITRSNRPVSEGSVYTPGSIGGSQNRVRLSLVELTPSIFGEELGITSALRMLHIISSCTRASHFSRTTHLCSCGPVQRSQ